MAPCAHRNVAFKWTSRVYDWFPKKQMQRSLEKRSFLTQQYRLFSNYSASLQIDMCYSDCTRIINTIFGIRQLLFVGIRYVEDSPIPSPDW